MSDMHELILDSALKIFKDHSTKEIIDQVEEGDWAGKLWDTMVATGITSIGISEDKGGTGGDFYDAFHVLRLAGKYAVPIPLAETIIANWILSDFGEVPRSTPTTLAIGDSDKWTISKNNSGVEITGSTKAIPWARFANEALILGEYEEKTVLCVLPLQKARITYNSNLAGEPSDEIIFNRVIYHDVPMFEVDEKRLLDKVESLASLTKSVLMSGAMEGVLELCVQYVKEREQFGRPLHRFQAIQQHLAVISGETIASLAATDKAIKTYERDFMNQDIAFAKISINEAAKVITEAAHQIHGAIGVTHEHRLHQLTRRLWAWREEYGNESYWAEKLALQVIKSDKALLWELIADSDVSHYVQ